MSKVTWDLTILTSILLYFTPDNFFAPAISKLEVNDLLADQRRGLFPVEEKRGDSGQHNHEDDKLPAGHSDMQKDGHGAKHEKYYHKKHNGSEGFHHITYISVRRRYQTP